MSLLLFHQFNPAILRPPFLTVIGGNRSEWADPITFHPGSDDAVSADQRLHDSLRALLGKLHVGLQPPDVVGMSYHIDLQAGIALHEFGNFA